MPIENCILNESNIPGGPIALQHVPGASAGAWITILVSEKLFPRVRDVVIHEDIQGSDHCPVEMVID